MGHTASRSLAASGHLCVSIGLSLSLEDNDIGPNITLVKFKEDAALEACALAVYHNGARFMRSVRKTWSFAEVNL